MNEELATNKSLDDIIKYIEKEYQTKIDDNMKTFIKNEIKLAIPKLNTILTPLITSAINTDQKALSQTQQEEFIKNFMKIMMPHMQKIMQSSE